LKEGICRVRDMGRDRLGEFSGDIKKAVLMKEG
jgi:hypothetical protein